MRGILDLDVLCLKEIFKFLEPLDLCSLRQSCTQLRDSVDDLFHSLYLVREQWLDLRGENIGHVNRILKNFGKLVSRLKVSEVTRRGKFGEFARRIEVGQETRLRMEVGQETRAQNLLSNVVLTNCGVRLKGLSLNDVRLYDIDIEKFSGVFDNLEVLELIFCNGDKKSFERLLLDHQYPNLKTLTIKYLSVKTEILKKFFMRQRSIKKLSCDYLSGDLLTLIALNGSEIEELDIFPENGRNLILLIELGKLKRLELRCNRCDQESIIALIKELSVNNQLDKLGMSHIVFTDEFCKALSNITNLKELRLWGGRCTSNDKKPLGMLGRKLSKLESLMLVDCPDFPYRNVLESACKSDKFRTIYFWDLCSHETKNFIEHTVKDFIEGRGHRCFVLGEPLCIYLRQEMFDDTKGLLTQDNLQSIEKYGNIKILRAKDTVSWFGF